MGVRVRFEAVKTFERLWPMMESGMDAGIVTMEEAAGLIAEAVLRTALLEEIEDGKV